MKLISCKWVRLVLAAAALAALSGCASMGGYDDEFSCPSAPQGSPCMSAIDAYHASENGLPVESSEPASTNAQQSAGDGGFRGPPGRTVPVAGGRAQPRAQPDAPAAPVGAAQPLATVHPPAAPALRALDTPLPIRTPAKVMRIYIAPWVGQSGDLTMPTYVYTEIEPRRWTIGERSASDASPHFYPLQVQGRGEETAGRGSPEHQGSAKAVRSMSINR